MRTAKILVVLTLGFFAATNSLAQEPETGAGAGPAKPDTSAEKPESKPVDKAADYSHEAFVIEQMNLAYRFENDGKGSRDNSVRIRVQTEAGVRELGQLIFGYSAEIEKLTVNYIRVRKSDGTVVNAGPEAVQDLTAPVAREAPMYTDYRQKHISVPALRPSDILEYSTTVEIQTPLAPGQFWIEHDFAKRDIVLDERLELNIPRGRTIRLKCAIGHDPKSSDEGDRRIYRWTASNTVREPEEDRTKRKRPSEPEPPAVSATTFSSWEDVGRWYARQERDRRQPTPEVRAKAEELVRGRGTDMEKVQALYDFVSKNFRYVSLSFGLGRVQPHPAAVVLANDYGDCKDKHTLLAALLEAIGFHASTVLIHSLRNLDPDVPSPAQFNHVITLVSVGKEQVWLDTTTEVAPFRLLTANLRKKQALVISTDGPARLMEVPADPPLASLDRTELQGKLTDLGKLSVHVHSTMRGDSEIPLRFIFRRVPSTQWKQVLTRAMESLGLRNAEIENIRPGDPADTTKPFELDFDLSRPYYVDWTSKQSVLRLPLGQLRLPPLYDDDDTNVRPLKIGPPVTSEYHLKLELPAKFVPRSPLAVSISHDYGDYRSDYRVEGNTLVADRSLVVRWRELPHERLQDFRAFQHAARADVAQGVSFENSASGSLVSGQQNAQELHEAGLAALRDGKFQVAADLFKRVVEMEPKHKFAWNNLGRAYIALRRYDDAVTVLHRQIEINPYDEFAYNNLGNALRDQRKYDEAAAAYRKQLEINPLDRYSHANLGGTYLAWRKYAEAVPELEKAITINPRDSTAQVRLGQAYLYLDQRDKALAAFNKAIEVAPNAATWNNVAYQLAQTNLEVDRAQRYAESAVATADAALRTISLERLTVQQIALVNSIAMYWDTLGWVYFRRGKLDDAEKYIRAAWQLGQHGEVADHLGQIAEKRGDKKEAIHLYALALAASFPGPDAREHLVALVGEGGVDKAVDQVRPELSQLRTIRLDASAPSAGKAEFFVLLSPDRKVEDVKFVNGNEEFRAFADALRKADYDGFTFPAGAEARLARRGVLSCASSPAGTQVSANARTGKVITAGEQMRADSVAPACVFSLIPPDTVRTVD